MEKEFISIRKWKEFLGLRKTCDNIVVEFLEKLKEEKEIIKHYLII